ncbi:MAG: DUF1464 family protein [Metallosphaera sp.]
MIFAGVDPGSKTYGVAFVDEMGRLVKYEEFLTELVEKDAYVIVNYLLRYKPVLISLPSGHGLPFIRARNIGEFEIFLMTLSLSKRGPLHEFLRASYKTNGITIPSVIELNTVPLYRKKNTIDLGTADKVASAFFYRTLFDSFVLVEAGSKFLSALVVINGIIVDGLGSSIIPGSSGFVDGEAAYLISQYKPLTKSLIYCGGEFERAIEIVEMFSGYYSKIYNIPIIVSGKRKHDVKFGLKFDFRFKEAAVGAAYIASAISGNRYKEYSDMLNSSGTPVDYLSVKGWDEIISWIKMQL